MSELSTSHVLVAFDSKKSKAFDGQRLAKIIYKEGKKTAKAHDSQCVSVPQISTLQAEIDAAIPALMPYVHAMLEDAQDKIIRERFETGAKEIQDSEINIAACLQWLEDDSKGNRLTKEVITEWFNTSLCDALTVAFADKLGIGDNPNEMEAKRIDQQVNVYREKFASLAGGKTSFAPEIAKKLSKALELASDDDLMAQRFVKRLEKMQEVPAVDMMGL